MTQDKAPNVLEVIAILAQFQDRLRLQQLMLTRWQIHINCLPHLQPTGKVSLNLILVCHDVSYQLHLNSKDALYERSGILRDAGESLLAVISR